MSTSMVYRPARSRRSRRGLVVTVAAVAVVGTAGAVAADALTPAPPASPAAASCTARVAGETWQSGNRAAWCDGRRWHAVTADAAGPAGHVAPHPAASKRPRLHIVRKLLLPLRIVRHVHRFFRIARNPFSLRRWFW